MESGKGKRMGEVLVELGLIDENGLGNALDFAKDKNLKLGEALIHLAYLKEDQVLGILGDFINVSVLDMGDITIPKGVQVSMPSERMRELVVIPIEIKTGFARVAFADPLNYRAVENVKFLINMDVSPVLASSVQILDILDRLDKDGYGHKDLALCDVKRSTSAITANEMTTDAILAVLDQSGCTDLHVTAGVSPAIRMNGRFKRSSMPVVTSAIMDNLVRELLDDACLEELDRNKDVEFSVHRPGMGRYRIEMYYNNDARITLSARKFLEDIPDLSTMGIASAIGPLLEKRGMIVVSATGGHGRDATIAAMVNHLNRTKTMNIITFEDPMVYIHHHKLSNVNQREVGRDTPKDVSIALERVFSQDPDVLVFSDIKDEKVMDAAVYAAHKGILVIAGINSMDVFNGIEEIVSILSDDYMRALFARGMIAVFAQRMMTAERSDKRILIWEMLIGTPKIQKYIMDNKAYYIKGQTTNLKDEYFPLEQSLADAIRNGRIERSDIDDEPLIDKDLLGIYMKKG